ncbi:UNVERIFIED_CONTAM: aminoacyltransferase, partial [Salmonella enterica subsp. enterica serovar Enteritidis]
MSIAETVQPRTNMGVDVTDDFTARYARNTRRAIKKAAKENLEAEIYAASDIRRNPDLLDVFSSLMHCTEDRKGVKLR